MQYDPLETRFNLDQTNGYVLSRAREAVMVYTDDKARLAESIQSSGARLSAHEMLRLPVSASTTDPFELMLREKVGIPADEPVRPDLKQEKDHADEKIQRATSPGESQQLKPFNYFEPEQPRQGISP